MIKKTNTLKSRSLCQCALAFAAMVSACNALAHNSLNHDAAAHTHALANTPTHQTQGSNKAQAPKGEILKGHALASAQARLNPYFKPGAPVRLNSPPQFELAQGDTLTVELGLELLAAGYATISIRADNYLQLKEAQSLEASAITLTGKQQKTLPVTVTAEQAALAYLHVFAEYTDAQGQLSVRTFAVAFDSRPPAARQKTTAPKPYVNMQANETIR